MPKYYGFKVYGYYLYFTSHCIVEAMHVHASDAKLTESGSAKFFVKADGGTRVAEKGRLSDKEVLGIQERILNSSTCAYNFLDDAFPHFSHFANCFIWQSQFISPGLTQSL